MIINLLIFDSQNIFTIAVIIIVVVVSFLLLLLLLYSYHNICNIHVRACVTLKNVAYSIVRLMCTVNE